jgi:hypothetical protein
MFLRSLLITVFAAPVHMQGKAGNRLRQHADTGIHSGHLHGCGFCDRLPGGDLSEKESGAGSGSAVSNFAFEKALKNAH